MVHEYTELIVVEGISTECVGNLRFGDFKLIDAAECYDYREVGYLYKMNNLSQFRRMTCSAHPPMLCFSRRYSLEGTHNENNSEVMRSLMVDTHCINVALRLFSVRTSDVKVVLGEAFDEHGISDSGKAGSYYLPTSGTNWKNYIQIDVTDDQIEQIFTQVREIMYGENADPRKHNFFWQLYGSVFGARDQRFVSIMVCFEYLLADKTVKNKGKVIATIVKRLLGDPSAYDKMVELYRIRNDYIHEAKNDRIEEVFPEAYELLVRVARILLDDGFDTGTLIELKSGVDE